MDKQTQKPNGNYIPNVPDIMLHHNHQESVNNRINCVMQPYNALVTPYSQAYIANTYGDYRQANISVPVNNMSFIPIAGNYDFARTPQQYVNGNNAATYLDNLTSQSMWNSRPIYTYPQQVPVKKDVVNVPGIGNIPCAEVKTENPLLVAENQSYYYTGNGHCLINSQGNTIEERDLKAQANSNRLNMFRQVEGYETVIALLNKLSSIPYLKKCLLTKGIDIDHFVERVMASRNHRLQNQKSKNSDKLPLRVEEILEVLRLNNSIGISHEIQLKIAYLSAEEMQTYSDILDCDAFHNLKSLKRRLKNRHAARGCRKRKSDEHTELQNRVNILKLVVGAMRSITADHVDKGSELSRILKLKDPKVNIPFNYKKPVDNLELEKQEFIKAHFKESSMDTTNMNGYNVSESNFIPNSEEQIPAMSLNVTPVSRVVPDFGAASVCTSKTSLYEFHSSNARRKLFEEEFHAAKNLKNGSYEEDYIGKDEELSYSGGILKGHIMKPSQKKTNNSSIEIFNASDTVNYGNYDCYMPYPAKFFSNKSQNLVDNGQSFGEPTVGNCGDMNVQTILNKMTLENPIAKTVFENMGSSLINMMPTQSFEISSNSAQKTGSPSMNDEMKRMQPSIKDVYNNGFIMSNNVHPEQHHQANLEALMK